MILDIIKTLKFYVFKYYVIAQFFLLFSINVIYNNTKKHYSLKSHGYKNYHDLSNVHSNFYFYVYKHEFFILKIYFMY